MESHSVISPPAHCCKISHKGLGLPQVLKKVLKKNSKKITALKKVLKKGDALKKVLIKLTKKK